MWFRSQGSSGLVSASSMRRQSNDDIQKFIFGNLDPVEVEAARFGLELACSNDETGISLPYAL